MSSDPAERMDVDDRGPPEHDAQASESEDENSEPEAPADLMVVSRARRSNAGNRMSTLLAKTAEEEAWGEEWEDAPNEEEFVGDDANEHDDFNMDSSSEDEDDEGGDDDAGEKELRRVERHDRVKKRKIATNPFAARLAAAAARKRVKLDVPASDAQPAPSSRPKKKSERASWIPTPEDGPTRTSSRKQTVANKETTLAKLKEKDRRRDDTLAMMKAAETRKQKDEPKALTQAERLAEAARVERVNSKSLHRWEEAEEQRAAERQAKIDAFKNRQIEGPFIRYYSGPAIWVDDKLRFTGKDAPKLEDLDEKLNKDVPAVTESQLSQSQYSMTEPSLTLGADFSEHGHGSLEPSQPSQGPSKQPLLPQAQSSQPKIQPLEAQIPQSEASQPPLTQSPAQDQSVGSHGIPYPSSIMFAPPQNPESFLFGIEQYATEQQPAATQNSPHPSQPSDAQTNAYPQSPSTQGLHSGLVQTPSTQADQSAIPPNPFSQPHPSLSDPALTQNPLNPLNPQSLLQQFQRPPAPPAPPRRKLIRRALRNLLILSSFPNLDAPPPTRARTTSSIIKDKDKSALVQLSATLFGWNTADSTAFVTAMLNAPKTKKEREGIKPAKKELCAVTNQVARYRDPGTGIAYRDQKAFAVLRGVVSGGFVWSGALACYVGGRARGPSGSRDSSSSGVKPAMGVPRRFVEMGKKQLMQAPAPVAEGSATLGNVEAEAPAADPAADVGEMRIVKMEDVVVS